MRQSIRGYADAVLEGLREGGAGGLRALAQELAAVRDVVAGSEDLQRVLVDPGIAAKSRSGVLDDLFAARVGDPAMRLVRFMAGNDRAAATVENLQWAAQRAAAAAGDLEAVGGTVLGRKAAEERLDGYATAVLEGVEDQRSLGEIEDELFRFQRVVGGSDQLEAALTSRDVPVANRESLVVDLLKGKATPEATRLAAYVTRVGRPRDYRDLVEALVSRVAEESNRRLAEVRSAVDLDEEQRRSLAEALRAAVGHDVEVRVTVDPGVVAGFVATVGDTVVDASARHRLEVLRERLVMPDVRIAVPGRAGPGTSSTTDTQSDTTTGERR